MEALACTVVDSGFQLPFFRRVAGQGRKLATDELTRRPRGLQFSLHLAACSLHTLASDSLLPGLGVPPAGSAVFLTPIDFLGPTAYSRVCHEQRSPLEGCPVIGTVVRLSAIYLVSCSTNHAFTTRSSSNPRPPGEQSGTLLRHGVRCCRAICHKIQDSMREFSPLLSYWRWPSCMPEDSNQPTHPL